MQPTFEAFKKACPDIDDKLIKEHISRLDLKYFKTFAKKDLFRHLNSIAALSKENMVELTVEKMRDGSVDCTVVAFDYPYVFSLITGILAGMGLNILSGDIFTYEKSTETSGKRKSIRRKAGLSRLSLSARRRIIDHFSGSLDSPLSIKNWRKELRSRINEIILLLEAGDKQSVKKAKNRVSEWVVKRLSASQAGASPMLYPVQIKMDTSEGAYNRLKVISEDTPAFLYALSNALSLQDIFIGHVSIRTIQGRVEDLIELVDSKGRAIKDEAVIDRVKLTTLLTKQFTYFLSMAPDPYGAISRFESMLEDILSLPDQWEWLQSLTNPEIMKDLAILLGASDFLWEDFIRLQYETFLPMLTHDKKDRPFSEPIETLEQRLDKALEGSREFEDQISRLNQFKDREIFQIDLDHILHENLDFRDLSIKLTRLAECILTRSAKLIYDELVKKHGTPQAVAGLPAKYTIVGMGKLGGAALGYASDIEILLVYSDNGQTDGDVQIENSEFFSKIVKNISQYIRTKREGIFSVDLRLRPYGDSGALASSFENFCLYYGKGGQSHSFERLALVRLRAVGGDDDFGRRLERIRDEMIYLSPNIDMKELRKLRDKQLQEKTGPEQANAKFSPGGLVDLEYGVQLLQVKHGKEIPGLRTPRIHEALSELVGAGVMEGGEGNRLMKAYDFLRQLINGLRMLRGSAKDLFLPPIDSEEFSHLARRMGYRGGGGLDAAKELYMDLETHMAVIRVFTEDHFGQEALTDSSSGTVVDLILSDSLSDEVEQKILEKARFKDSARARKNLKELAGQGLRRETFARLALLALDILERKADPDRALNNWERYLRTKASPDFHFSLLLSQPMRLEIFLSIFSESQFLADTLVRNPGFLDWVMMPEILHRPRNRDELESELENTVKMVEGREGRLNTLRRIRRREILRIGIRDICIGVPMRVVMEELSTVAEALVHTVLDGIRKDFEEQGRVDQLQEAKDRFCVLAFGKLGGRELNYSSDIDLIGIWDDRDFEKSGNGENYNAIKTFFQEIMERVRADLSTHMEEGYAYRVDLRLRPYGRGGELVPALSSLLDYYQSKASMWEIQAALKLRPIAGNLRLGYDFLQNIRPVILSEKDRVQVVDSIERLRRQAVNNSSGRFGRGLDVKNGEGGIRDVEFLAQGLQLVHGSKNEALIDGNTMNAIDLLFEAGIIPEDVSKRLRKDYLFLRKTEHYLQIMDDRQIHELPRSNEELDALAKRIIGIKAGPDLFMETLEECLKRVRGAYEKYLLSSD